MPATDPTTSGSPTPAQQQPSPLPEFLGYKFANSTPVGYRQLDSDGQ